MDNLPLELEFSISDRRKLDLDLVESSFDLLANRAITMIQRNAGMMPMPFVLNDAVIIKQKVKASPKSPNKTPEMSAYYERRDTLTVAVDSLKR